MRDNEGWGQCSMTRCISSLTSFKNRDLALMMKGWLRAFIILKVLLEILSISISPLNLLTAYFFASLLEIQMLTQPLAPSPIFLPSSYISSKWLSVMPGSGVLSSILIFLLLCYIGLSFQDDSDPFSLFLIASRLLALGFSCCSIFFKVRIIYNFLQYWTLPKWIQ